MEKGFSMHSHRKQIQNGPREHNFSMKKVSSVPKQKLSKSNSYGIGNTQILIGTLDE
jgi:hypothetical protein